MQENQEAAGTPPQIVDKLSIPPANEDFKEEKDKHEEVDLTLKDIALQRRIHTAQSVKQKRGFKYWTLLALKIVFFPFTLIALGFKWLTRRFKMRITFKTTITFIVVFAILLTIYAVFINISVANQLKGGDLDTEGYLQNLKITSLILVVLFIAVGAVVGGIASQYMLSPVRSMTERVNEISSDNLSARLDPVDAQDELMELTKQINEMLDSLEESFSRQAHFVSDASHELKTPLSVITGYANLLKRWGKDDKKILDEGIDAISREAVNMKKIVEQLLWLAKIGNFTLNRREFDLNEALSDIVESYIVLGTKHKITYTGATNITLNTDRNLLTEAVRTLIDNAIKYTPQEQGAINIVSRAVDAHAEITVSDNGIGISEQDLPNIFDRFYRCDKARGRESGSSGLGLTIAKSIITMMGGTIEVKSTVGKGTSFTIKLY